MTDEMSGFSLFFFFPETKFLIWVMIHVIISTSLVFKVEETVGDLYLSSSQ